MTYSKIDDEKIRDVKNHKTTENKPLPSQGLTVGAWASIRLVLGELALRGTVDGVCRAAGLGQVRSR